MMLRTYFLVMILALFGVHSKAQESEFVESDSIVYHLFVGGKPYMEYVWAEEDVLRNLGFSVETILAGCVGPFEPKASYYRIKNEPAYRQLQILLGDDWKEKLNTRVEEEMKHIRK